MSHLLLTHTTACPREKSDPNSLITKNAIFDDLIFLRVDYFKKGLDELIIFKRCVLGISFITNSKTKSYFVNNDSLE